VPLKVSIGARYVAGRGIMGPKENRPLAGAVWGTLERFNALARVGDPSGRSDGEATTSRA